MYQEIRSGTLGRVRIIKSISRDFPFPPIEYLKTSGKYTSLDVFIVYNITTGKLQDKIFRRKRLSASCLLRDMGQGCLIIFQRLFVFVEVLRPSQPNGVMSSAVSLPSHTFTGQANSSKRLTSIVHILSQENFST